MKYTVTVAYTMKRKINVHARDEETAAEKACEIVDAWKDVISTEAVEVVEE